MGTTSFAMSQVMNHEAVSFEALEEGSDGGSSTHIPGERNTDRLKRNRESAKRCRLRRKEYIQGVESTAKVLDEKNQALMLENSRLQLMLDQLLGTPRSLPTSLIDTGTIPCAKRIKIENGVTAADFTESTDTHSQQLEITTYSLAKVTTFLFLIASTLLVSNPLTAAWTQATTAQNPLKLQSSPFATTCYKTDPHGSKISTLLSSWHKHHPPIRWHAAAAG